MNQKPGDVHVHNFRIEVRRQGGHYIASVPSPVRGDDPIVLGSILARCHDDSERVRDQFRLLLAETFRALVEGATGQPVEMSTAVVTPIQTH